jgi:hypothetical protein
VADDGHFWRNIEKLKRKKKKKKKNTNWASIFQNVPQLFFIFFTSYPLCMTGKRNEKKIGAFLIIHKTYNLGLYPTLNIFALGRRYAEQCPFFFRLDVTWIASI